jgi:DNA polymerase III sliding clamp (beta) subunit (PCNA family)
MIVLQDGRERKDMIKDVNIAMSKLDRLKVEGATRNHYLKLARKELEASYNNYMSAIGEDPDIKLTEGENRGLDAAKKVEIYSRKSNEMFAQ